MRPALENIAQKVITSRMTNQVPILLAPLGRGLLEKLISLYLSTYISTILLKKARIKLLGNESPKSVKKQN